MNCKTIKRFGGAIRDCFSKPVTFEEIVANDRLNGRVKVVRRFSGEEVIGTVARLVSPPGYITLDDAWYGRQIPLNDIREISPVEP